MEIPKRWKDLKGTVQKLGGGLFSSNKEEPEAEYNVLDLRWGAATIMDMKTMEETHPTIELLVKKDGMRASRWTKGFKCTDIDLRKQKKEAGE